MRKPSFFYSWRDFGFGLEILTPNGATRKGHISALNVVFGPFRIVFWIGTRSDITWHVDGEDFVMRHHIRCVEDGIRLASFFGRHDRDTCVDALMNEHPSRGLRYEDEESLT